MAQNISLFDEVWKEKVFPILFSSKKGSTNLPLISLQMSHGMPRDFGSIPYTVTEIIRFINQQNSVLFIHKSANGLTLLSHPGTPHPRKPQIQATRTADYASVQLQKPGLLCIIVHRIQPQGKRPFLFQICLITVGPRPWSFTLQNCCSTNALSH